MESLANMDPESRRRYWHWLVMPYFAGLLCFAAALGFMHVSSRAVQIAYDCGGVACATSAFMLLRQRRFGGTRWEFGSHLLLSISFGLFLGAYWIAILMNLSAPWVWGLCGLYIAFLIDMLRVMRRVAFLNSLSLPSASLIK